MKRSVILLIVFALVMSGFVAVPKKTKAAATGTVVSVTGAMEGYTYFMYQDTTMSLTRGYAVGYKVSGSAEAGYSLALHIPSSFMSGINYVSPISSNLTRTLINDIMTDVKGDKWTNNKKLVTLRATGFEYISTMYEATTLNIVLQSRNCTMREGLSDSSVTSTNAVKIGTINVTGAGTMTFKSNAFKYKGKDTVLNIKNIDATPCVFESGWSASGGLPDTNGPNCNVCNIISGSAYATAPAGHTAYLTGITADPYHTNASMNASKNSITIHRTDSSMINSILSGGGSTTVSIVHRPNRHKVTYDAGVDGVNMTFDGVNWYHRYCSVDVLYGQGIPYPTLSGRTGYTGSHWSSSIGNTPSVMPDADITVTAQWTPVDTIAYFHPQGGVFTDTGGTDWRGFAPKYDSTLTFPTVRRDGYTFTGWSLNNAICPGSTYPIKDTSTKYFYATWSPNTYEISFDANGGNLPTGTTTKQVLFNTAVGALPTPTRAGYDFAGWFTALQNGSQVLANTVYQTAGNLKLYAIWSPKTYTITFNTEGGTMPSGAANKITVNYGSTYPKLPTPTRTGYEFLGWRLKTNAYIKTGGTVGVTSNETAYATWKAKTYKVSFNANGGTISNGVTDKIATFGQQYGELPQPTRDNYIFNGWTTESGMAVDSRSVCIIDGDHTLVANWLQETAQVVLNPNGGTCATIKFTAYNGKPFGELPTPTRKSYIFLGWFTQLEGGEQITKDTVAYLTEDITLYAHWSAQKYKVTFDPAGGTCDTPSMEVVYMGKYQNLPVAVRPGYKFEGWFTSLTNWEEIEEGATVNIMEDITLYAHWSKETYVISFDGNGGKAGQPSKSVLYDSTYGTLPTAKWKLHKFKGWYTAPTGGTKITAKSKVTITENTTLYAQWKAEPIKLVLNGNGGKIGKAKTKTMTVAYDEVYGKLPSPKRKGYKFKGWYTKKSGGKKVTEKSYCMETGKHTLYARWTKVKTAKASIKKLTPKTKALVVQWKKVKGANGYEVSYSTSKKFTKKTTKTKTIKNNKTLKLTIKKLKAKKKYYVRVRAFKYDSYGKKIYGKWSQIKKIKVK